MSTVVAPPQLQAPHVAEVAGVLVHAFAADPGLCFVLAETDVPDSAFHDWLMRWEPVAQRNP